MKAVISNYRRSGNQQTQNQAIIQVDGVTDRKEAEKLLKKTFIFKINNKEIKSKRVASVGNKGRLRILFEKGLPGQAIGKEIKIQ